MNRRTILRASALAPIALLPVACAPGSQGDLTLAQAKMWVSALSGAVLAASDAYTGPSADRVKQYAAQLQQAADDFAAMGDVSTAQKAAQSVLTLANQVWALVSPALPPSAQQYAQYVPMAILVIQAFIGALPPPKDVPPVPPAELQRAALTRHRR